MRRTLMGGLLAAAVTLAGCNDDPSDVLEAPAPPRALEATYYAGAVTLTWELAPAWDGESFRVYGKRASDADYFFIAEVTSCIEGFCSYTDTNIGQDITYEYYVSAWDVGSGLEAASEAVEVFVPEPIPPAVPAGVRVIALDDANYVTWSENARGAADFSFYRVYQAAADGNDYLLGETDSEGFVDLLAVNGSTYDYFVTSVDVDGHESEGSGLASGTPRPDFTAELLTDYHDDPEQAGFRFQVADTLNPIRHGDAPEAHFSVERDGDGFWWLLPGPEAEANPNGVFATALKCGVAADLLCEDVAVAPASGYGVAPIPIDPELAYFLRVTGDDGEVHYGVIRVSHTGVNQSEGVPIGVIIFDWAYQLQPGNRNLAPKAP